MIVPRGAIAPLALLVALATTTTVFSLGIREAPETFFTGADLIVGPPGGELPGNAPVDATLVDVMRALPHVRAVSPEIFAPTSIAGRSVMVRGVDMSDFFAIEEARITEGSLPGKPHEAVAGAGLAKTHGITVGDRVFVPATFSRLAVHFLVTGIAEMESSARDELLVPLPAARELTHVDSHSVHLIRVSSSEPARMRSLVEAVTPTFTLTDVRISTHQLVPGEPGLISADLTNWGRAMGSHTVTVFQEGAPLAAQDFRVPARTTVPIEVAFKLDALGAANITVNPTFEVSVREPTLFFEDPGAIEEGMFVAIRVHDPSGSPAPGVEVRVGQMRSLTDGEGLAGFQGFEAGSHTLMLVRGDLVEGAGRIFVAEQGHRHVAKIGPVSIAVPEFVRSAGQINITVRLDNRGGVAGTYHGALLVDGEERIPFEASVGPGETVHHQVPLFALHLGTHSLATEDASAKARFTVIEGDPRVEPLLRAYDAQRAGALNAPPLRAEGDAYVTRLLGDVSTAVLVLAIAASTLSALCAIAVMERHLATRAPSVGVLKALGASDVHVIHLATVEAAARALIAAPIGILAGLGLSAALDRTGLVRGFGHAVHPSYAWAPILTIFIVAVLFTATVGRILMAGMLRNRTDSLLRDTLTRKRTDDAPDLHGVIPPGGGR